MDNEIRDNLEKQFKKLMPDDAPPEQLKDEIFQTLDTVNMIGDVADLFTSKFMQTSAKLIGVITDEEQVDELVYEAVQDESNEITDNNDDESYKMEEPGEDSQE